MAQNHKDDIIGGQRKPKFDDSRTSDALKRGRVPAGATRSTRVVARITPPVTPIQISENADGDPSPYHVSTPIDQVADCELPSPVVRISSDDMGLWNNE